MKSSIVLVAKKLTQTFQKMILVSLLHFGNQNSINHLFHLALNEKAASSQLAEQQFTSGKIQPEKPRDLEYERASATMASAFATLLAEEDTSAATQAQPATQINLKRDTQFNVKQYSSEVPHTRIEQECLKCVDAVLKKLSWSRLAIESESDPSVVSDHLKVITGCTKALSGLQKLTQ